MPDAAALDVVEARLRGILSPYLGRLEPFEVYGVTMLRRPGAGAHDWFAGVRRGPGGVKFSLLAMHTHPEVLEDASPALRRHRSGASILTFNAIDDELAADLSALVARAFTTYVTEPA